MSLNNIIIKVINLLIVIKVIYKLTLTFNCNNAKIVHQITFLVKINK